MNSELEQALESLADMFGASAAREVCLSATDGRVSRIALPNAQITIFQQIAHSLGLNAWQSKIQQVPKADIGKGGFANQNYATFDADHPWLHTLVYVANKLSDAQAAATNESQGDTTLVAASLRYPACCTRFYEEHCEQAASHHQGDLFPLSVHKSSYGISAPATLNFASNYFGGSWCSFFPCSLDCVPAQNLIHHERQQVRRYAPRLASQIDAHARGAIVYTEYNGVAWIPQAHQDRLCIRYAPESIHVTLDSNLSAPFRALSAGDGVHPLSNGGFRVLAGTTIVWEETSRGSYARLFV
jgi:hypothetical protein